MKLTVRLAVFGWQIATIGVDVNLPDTSTKPAAPLPAPVAGATKWLSRQWIKGMLA